MTFLEWLWENYRCAGTEEGLVFAYSAEELEYMYNEYEKRRRY